MSTEVNWQQLWRQQAKMPAPSAGELASKARKLRLRERNRILFSVLLIALTVAGIGGMMIVWKPQLVTSYIGLVLTFAALFLQLAVSGNLLSLLVKKEDPDRDARQYLAMLVRIRRKQRYLHTRVLSWYFLLLSAGIFLYMIESTRNMSSAGILRAYGFTAFWFALAWFWLRPMSIRRQAAPLDKLIRQWEEVQGQLNREEEG